VVQLWLHAVLLGSDCSRLRKRLLIALVEVINGAAGLRLTIRINDIVLFRVDVDVHSYVDGLLLAVNHWWRLLNH